MPKEPHGTTRIAHGNIFNYTGVLVHQTRAMSINGKAAGIASQVRTKLDVDPYPPSVIGKRLDMGSIRIDQVPNPASCITHVIHLTGQVYSGRAYSSGLDSEAARYTAFKKGLAAIIDEIRVGRIKPTTILFPKIGCGLAGGCWERYKAAIDEFAATVPEGFHVLIVALGP